MSDLFTQPIEAITVDDVAALLEHGPAEGPSVEYKAALSEAKEEPDPWMAGKGGIGGRARDRIVKEVVAFANAGGGTLVVGIEESSEDPPRPSAIRPLPRCAALANHLTDVLKSAIDPALPLIHIRPVPTEGDAGVVVIRVPTSRRAPHRCANTRHAYKRFHHQSTPIDMREIHEMVLHTRSGLERLEQAFADHRRRFEKEWGEAFPHSNQHGYAMAVAVLPLAPLALGRMTDNVPGTVSLLSLEGRVSTTPSDVGVWMYCPLSGGDRRPIVRGARFESSTSGLWSRREVYQDGSVVSWLRADRDRRGPNDPEALPLIPEWAFAVIGNAILSANWLRHRAGLPEQELAIEVAFYVPQRSRKEVVGVLPWEGTRISPVRKLVPLEATPDLPRYSLGTFAELPELLHLMHRDFWDSTGVAFTADLTINLSQWLAYAAVEAAE